MIFLCFGPFGLIAILYFLFTYYVTPPTITATSKKQIIPHLKRLWCHYVRKPEFRYLFTQNIRRKCDPSPPNFQERFWLWYYLVVCPPVFQLADLDSLQEGKSENFTCGMTLDGSLIYLNRRLFPENKIASPAHQTSFIFAVMIHENGHRLKKLFGISQSPKNSEIPGLMGYEGGFYLEYRMYGWVFAAVFINDNAYYKQVVKIRLLTRREYSDVVFEKTKSWIELKNREMRLQDVAALYNGSLKLPTRLVDVEGTIDVKTYMCVPTKRPTKFHFGVTCKGDK